MNNILIAIFFIITTSTYSQQFKSVEIGVDGLTCSMCTRTTELNIRKLNFVDSVIMDLSNTNGVITFKKGSEVSLEKIAKAVYDAGFSLRYLKAEFHFDTLNLTKGLCFSYHNEQYKYVGNEDKTVTGNLKMLLIGKKFMHAKEFKKWATSTNDACVTDKKTYYVSL